MSIEWADPPDSSRMQKASKYAELAAALRDRPRTWAVIGRYNKATTAANQALAIRRGVLAAFRPVGDYEARSVTSNGQATVYARYVGEPDG